MRHNDSRLPTVVRSKVIYMVGGGVWMRLGADMFFHEVVGQAGRRIPRLVDVAANWTGLGVAVDRLLLWYVSRGRVRISKVNLLGPDSTGVLRTKPRVPAYWNSVRCYSVLDPGTA